MAKFYSYLLYCFLFSLNAKDVLSKKSYHSKKFGHKIVGGYNATIQDYPYQVYLLLKQGNNYYQCGGSIISPNYVLTAAHCLANKQKVFARFGSTNSDEGGTMLSSTDFKQHPRYNSLTMDYDIGFVRFSQDINIDGTNTRAVTLADEGSTIAPGTNVIISGWGTTSEGGDTSQNLMAVQVPTVSNTECRRKYRTLSPRMFCAGVPEGGKDSCQGDSGGPAVTDDLVQVGVVSFGIGCARPNTPGVYAYVPGLRRWIKDNTGV